MWAAAFLALALYGLSNLIAGAMVSGRRDPPFRIFRALAVGATILLAFLPGLLLALYAPMNILGLAPYCVFMAGYCYAIGKRVGFFRGRTHFNGLIGIESRETIEEIQDRLLESRMRHPSRVEVVKSIGELARRGKTDPGAEK
jgi:hypothetical protein